MQYLLFGPLQKKVAIFALANGQSLRHPKCLASIHFFTHTEAGNLKCKIHPQLLRECISVFAHGCVILAEVQDLGL